MTVRSGIVGPTAPRDDDDNASIASFDTGRVSLFARKLSLGFRPETTSREDRRRSWEVLEDEERQRERRASEILQQRITRRASVTNDLV